MIQIIGRIGGVKTFINEFKNEILRELEEKIKKNL